MKNILPLIALSIFNLINSYGQAEVCKKPAEDTFEDLNVISVKKCDVTDKNDSRKIIKTKTIRKRVRNIRVSKNHSDTKNLSREVLFTLVQEIPMFDSCNKSTRKNDVKCFKRKIKKHFSKNFYAEKFNNKVINDKIFIKFSIDLYGNVVNTQIKSKKQHKELHHEINRILQKLPSFTPGKEKGLPVIVIYSFTFNLTLS